MDKFAFLVHPLSIEHYLQTLGKLNFIFKKMSSYTLKEVVKGVPPYVFAHSRNIISKTGELIEGYVIMCPLTPDQLVSLKQGIAKNKILDAIKLARRCGAKVVGLGGFTSIVTEGGKEIAQNVDMALTSGNAFTSAMVIDGLLKVAAFKNIDLKKSTIAIIGATGDIGSICSKVLSSYIPNLILVARDRIKLENLKKIIIQENGFVHVVVTTDIRDAIKNSNFVLSATSAVVPIIDPADLFPGTILCDVSYPGSIDLVKAAEYKNIFVFKGGLAHSDCFKISGEKIKQKIRLFNFDTVLPGCLSETIILTFEKKFENFSVGRGEITIKRINEIREIGLRHGFELPTLF